MLNKVKKSKVLAFVKERRKTMYSFKFDKEWTEKVTTDTQEINDLKHITNELQKIDYVNVLDKEDTTLHQNLSSIQEKENKVKSLVEALRLQLDGVQAYMAEVMGEFDLVKAQEAQENICALQEKVKEQTEHLAKIAEEKQTIEKECEAQKQQEACFLAYTKAKELLQELPKERISKILLHEDQLTPFLGSYFHTIKGEMLDDYGENS